MDQRVSTAPNTKGRKWLSHNANPGGKFLLRQASGHPSSSHPEDDFAVVDRPQTYPGSRLTPEFHWNLNNSALKTLSTVQVEQLYGLFKFYDSSTAGDALPSINCSHFIEILRDARLLSDSSTDSAERGGLQVTSIERIFAQATMGKMRMHLDVNGQPALTFSLFCGALMNCAMVLSPLVHPETALQKMLPVLLHSSIADGHYFSSARGLLSHLPTESLWTPETSQVLLPQLEHAEQDFLELPIFQEVIEDCEEDIVLEELKQEKLAQHYKIPNRLCASFYPDTIAHISTKFRMFDVFDSVAHDIPNNDCIVPTPDNKQNLAEDKHDARLECMSNTITVHVNTPLSATKPETIRIYLLLGGEHDGAIYCTLSLVLATREIVESEGIYYSTVPSETTQTAAVLPTQHNLTNALVMLKKRVQAKLEEGFDLLPPHQLDIVEEMLQDLRKRLPHFSSPVTKPPRNSAIAAISTPIFSPPPDGMNYFIPSVNRVKSSQLRHQKLPPRSKAVPHRLTLPSNYKDLCTTWGISQHENYAWIHDINAASPLKLAIPTTKSVRAGHLSPLRVPLRHDTCS
ncbi:hypothetical protein PRNP1_004492 [Phytophthora ramorum]